ncbi:unnamed protein product (macronuclear) [Paramecium tetraurelia]|uniref:Uncharacterized protein n=1 Tax=Paramecium tetraurelia TaxID=5888 RepID=A0BWR2_PARTE|nr:uncharacterized protein GSPATT00032831001 [Paramecium tetraurelia]CAK62979.1 unnamed protein product [Paramecium tetraurelia]|eukprot:XP_001430377.1 hypothetical protein (macronuclear) [Paramecium tetraurelia strain d4-2]
MYNKHLLSTKNLDGPKLDTTQVRRKSCVCDQCGETALKENQLPNQLCEIAYHKKERLADVFLSKLDGARKYMRNDHKKKNFRIYARNPLFILRSKPDLDESMHLQTSPTKTISPEQQRIKTEQPQIVHSRSHKYVPTSNCFLQNIKQQVLRQEKTINRLLKDRKAIQSVQFSPCEIIPTAKSPQKNKKIYMKQLKPLPKQKQLQTKFNCLIREFFNSSKSKQY